MIDRTTEQGNGQHACAEQEEGEKIPFTLFLSLSIFARARALLLVVLCFYSPRTLAFARTTIYRFLAFAFTSRGEWVGTRDVVLVRSMCTQTHIHRQGMLVCYDECHVFDVVRDGDSIISNEREKQKGETLANDIQSRLRWGMMMNNKFN